MLQDEFDALEVGDSIRHDDCAFCHTVAARIDGIGLHVVALGLATVPDQWGKNQTEWDALVPGDEIYHEDNGTGPENQPYTVIEAHAGGWSVASVKLATIASEWGFGNPDDDPA